MSNLIDFTPRTNYTLRTVEAAMAALGHQVEIGKGKEAGLSYSAEGVEVRTPRGMGRFTWKEWENGKKRMGISGGEDCDGQGGQDGK